MTDPVLPILQHALGVDRFGRGNMYRDHFVAGPGHADYDTCMTAAEAGLMRRYDAPHLCGGVLFIVTEAGRAYVRAESPRPDRRQLARDRYARFLDVRDIFPDLTFGQFLARKDLHV